jgi:RNase H-like domain found in reverse transcriptase
MRNNISELESSKTIKQLRRVQGFINFVAKYIPLANKELKVLNSPLKGNAKRLIKNEESENTFIATIKKIGSYDEICPVIYKKDMYLVCDASDHGVGSVLLLTDKQNIDLTNIKWEELRIANCFSKLLTLAVKNYTTTEKEIKP